MTDPASSTGAPRPPRPSIEERARRRSELDAADRDRYASLLRHLRAGQEIALEPPRDWRDRLEALDWHPIAGRLLVAITLVVALYLALTAVTGWLREGRIDTWSGPDATVQSGQRLDGCPGLVRLNDAVLPNWLRYRGDVFQLTEVGLPLGESNIGRSYLPTPYALGDLRLFEVRVQGLGPMGSRLIVRNGNAPAGQLYRRLDSCS